MHAYSWGRTAAAAFAAAIAGDAVYAARLGGGGGCALSDRRPPRQTPVAWSCTWKVGSKSGNKTWSFLLSLK